MNVKNFIKNPSEFILSNSNCSFLYEIRDTSILDISIVCDEGNDTNIKNYIALGEKCESVFDLENTMKNCNSELREIQSMLPK